MKDDHALFYLLYGFNTWLVSSDEVYMTRIPNDDTRAVQSLAIVCKGTARAQNHASLGNGYKLLHINLGN